MERLKGYVSPRHPAGSAAQLADYRDAIVGMEEVINAKDAELARHEDEEQRLAARVLELERQCAELLGRRNERESAYGQLQDKLAAQIEATARVTAHFERRVRELELAVAGGGGREPKVEHESEPTLRAPAVAPPPPIAPLPAAPGDSSRGADPSWIRRLGVELRSLTQEQGAMQTEIVRAAAQVTALDRVREDAVREGGLLRAELAAASWPAARDHEPRFDARDQRGAPRPPAGARRLVTTVDGASLSYPLRDGDMTIGRSKHCDICIPSHFVSRIHATLSIRSLATLIADADSKNGIFVNSVRVHRHELHDGDVISLGGQLDLLFVDGKS
ncbi:MAG TPA: FHA domain-containing protein [Gammaproteobacteria bacterium]|nr:FHA domain-containing protein [Gammaproteobacteria bacterium]